MADNRLTKKRLKNHFAYNWWKYALSAAVSAMLVSIVFAVTAYRPPAEKKVELYVLNGYIDAETFQRDFWPELQARKPEQEELTVLNINLTDSSNIYAPMQFSTYVAAQQGDLFLISRDEMRRITADGAQEALVELTGYLDSGVIDADGMDLKNGTLDPGRRHDGGLRHPRRYADGAFAIRQRSEKQPALHPDVHEERGQRGGADRADAGEAGSSRKMK